MSNDETLENMDETTAGEPTLDAGDGEQFEFVEDPVFEIENKGDCAYEVKVSVPPANIAKQSSLAYDGLRSEAALPGFRKGRAPHRLLERKFGRHIKGEVYSTLAQEAYKKLIEDKDLKPVTYPDVEGLDAEIELPEGAPLEFTIKFEVAARAELGRYRGIEVKRPVIHLDEADIDAQLERVRERSAKFEAVTEGAAVKGDQVTIAFAGTIDGEPFPGGSSDGYPYIVGSQRFLPELEAAIEGIAPGGKAEVDLTFPEDYNAEDLRGKTAHFIINALELSKRNLPELNDDFARTMSFDSLDAMRQSVRDRLEEHYSEQSTHLAQENAITQIIETSTFELPESTIGRLATARLNHQMQSIARQNISPEELAKIEGELAVTTREEAIAELKRMTVLDEIIEAEGVEVTEEDMEKGLAEQAASMNMDSKALSEFYANNTDRLTNQMHQMRIAKAIGVIMDNAAIVDTLLTDETDTKADGE